PNEYRTASGAPGNKYWQQRCDYDIVATLDETQRKLTGKETITYYNNSPDNLSYLWLQLDENEHSAKNNAGYQNSSTMPRGVTKEDLDEDRYDKEYGFNITKVTTDAGVALKYTINKTMMRVDLPKALKP